MPTLISARDAAPVSRSVRIDDLGKWSERKTGVRPSLIAFSAEALLVALILTLTNLPLLGGTWNHLLAFFPTAVLQGEWWRLVTHPFVHISWYHLLLDGTAFFMLHAELRYWSSRRRIIVIALSALGSLAGALTSPVTWEAGFGGLSGVAHGLTAVAALEMIRREDSWERRAGWCAFTLVLAKATLEAVTGRVALGFLHFGLMGTPVAACHAGGVAGGLLALALMTALTGNRRNRR